MSHPRTHVSREEAPSAPVQAQAVVPWKAWELLALAFLAGALILWKHGDFHSYVADLTEDILKFPPTRYFQSTDEYFLLKGFHRAPDLWQDGLAWWHGPWIHALTRFFRPVASYLHWMHCYIGLRWGFDWVGWLGIALFWIACLLGAALAWRMTRSKVCVFLATIGEVLFTSGKLGAQPAEWIAWFPSHPDIVAGELMLGALVAFDLWIERARRRFLLLAWLLFLIACGVKEHAYIFPVMALALALLRHDGNTQLRVSRKHRTAQALAMLAAVALLAVCRAAVMPDAGGPKFSEMTFSTLLLLVNRSVNDVFPVLPLPPFAHRAPLLLLSLFWLAQGWAYWRLTQSTSYRRFRALPLAGVVVFFGMLAVALFAAHVAGTLILFADPEIGLRTLVFIGELWLFFYSLVLFVRYRARYPTALSLLLIWLAYVPIAFATVGWHYQLIGSLFRFQFTALFLLLAAVDLRLIEDHLPPLRERFRRLSHKGGGTGFSPAR